jgi:hypothetical protein
MGRRPAANGSAARRKLLRFLAALHTAGEFLMLALLHKRIYEKKRRHHYWVHPVLCTGLETG